MKCIHESKYKYCGFSELGYYVFANAQATQSDEFIMVESAKYILNNGRAIYLTNGESKRVGFPDDLLTTLRLKAGELCSNPLNEEIVSRDKLAI